MSRAFVKEDNDLPERPAAPRLPPPLPAGVRNLLTAEGERRLRSELARLVEVERPRWVAAGDTPDDKRALREADARIAHIQQCLHGAEIVRAPEKPWLQVKLGATVTVRERNDEQAQYRIVGFHEADLEPHWISFRSPLARALMEAKVGERVRFKIPAGEEELEVLAIDYG